MRTFADLGIPIPPTATQGEVSTTCPKCSASRQKKPNTPCLQANVTTGLWHCHHCGWGGSLANGEERTSTPAKIEYYRPPPTLPVGEISNGAVTFFKSRGISEATLHRAKVCTGRAWIPQFEDYATAIFFPYFDKGSLRNIKYRAQPKHFCMVAGAELVPYGLDDIRDADTVIWVEGEIDKLSLDEAGYLNSLSVPNGAPPANSKSYSSKLDFLTPYEELFSTKRHYLAVDNDEPGKKLEDELSRRLGRENCWLVSWPEGCKDANDVLKKLGKTGIVDAINAAVPYPIEGILTIHDAFNQIITLYRDGLPRGKPTGWENVDQLYTVRGGELCIVTGMPGSGKSEWIDALMVNLAETYGWRFGVFSPENSPVSRHVAKLVEKQAGLPFGRGKHDRINPEGLSRTLAWLNNQFFFIEQHDDGLTVDAVLTRCGALVKRYGINGLVIDPWNEIDHTRPANLTETEYISQSLTKFRRFARRHGVHLWLVAHPTKLKKDEKGKYPAPTPYDINGSAHWRNKADDCITVHRDPMNQNGEVEIHIGKIRFKEVGRVGVTTLHYDKITGRYSTPQGWNDHD